MPTKKYLIVKSDVSNLIFTSYATSVGQIYSQFYRNFLQDDFHIVDAETGTVVTKSEVSPDVPPKLPPKRPLKHTLAINKSNIGAGNMYIQNGKYYTTCKNCNCALICRKPNVFLCITCAEDSIYSVSSHV